MQLKVYGIVQGVGFRPFVYKIAKRLGYTGYVRNNGSNVEIVLAEDPKRFIDEFWSNLPPLAKVDHIDEIDSVSTDELLQQNRILPGEFEILLSTDGIRESTIPPDTALCDECHEELFNSDDRRYLYPFINCTNCGARFSVISDMPYDRDKTSMEMFKLCNDCQNEFSARADRRMHAQTISCPSDGPTFSLYSKDGHQVPTETPIKDFAAKLDSGAIGIIKSWGGMHIVSAPEEIKQLREWYKRPEKPFAVMARNLEAAEQYCKIDDHARRCLELPERPIVLVPKLDDTEHSAVLELVAPGLDTVGLYLPYSAIQYLLFHYLEHDALIMTSANPRGEPLIITNTEAFALELDAYLFHNRNIINRVDDSLIIPHGLNYYFIRRSRGYVPLPIEVDYDQIILGVGAERNVTASVSKNGKLYLSQYIGNTNYYKTLEFLNEASQYLMGLLGIDQVDAITLDLHPQYPTRKLATELAERFGVQMYDHQHHWCHATSLMLDNKITAPIVALSLDGAGYGSDGTVWGGEVLTATFDSFKHSGSLELIPLIGGDQAVHEPKRLVFGIYEKLGLNAEDLSYFPSETAEVFRKMMPNSPVTSSLGRVLDSLACYFGIAEYRTYDGEPAMKLERYLVRGKPSYEFEVHTVQPDDGPKRVQTLNLFKQLFDHVGSRRAEMLPEPEKADLCYSFVNALISKLVNIGLETAKNNSVNYLGITGGVTYNIPIADMCRAEFVRCSENDGSGSEIEFITHSRLPNGDGGISAGQNVITGALLSQN